MSGVGVLPTHHRRGLLTALMRGQLERLRDEDTAVASLWASQTAIYQRYGYGLGSWRGFLDVHTPGAAFSAEGRAVVDRFDGSLDLLTSAPLEELRAVYDAFAAVTPGMTSRPEPWWNFALEEDTSGGASPRRFLLARNASGAAVGYLTYRTVLTWSGHDDADSLTKVEEVVATDPAVYAALWRFVLDLPLSVTLTASRQRQPDPLLGLLANPRAAKPKLVDGLWVRLVDVPKALARREFDGPVGVTLRVHDAFCPWNDGTWRVTNDGVEAASGAPDLELSATELGCAYLGQTTLAQLAASGRVVEHRAGALREASRAFAWPVTPHCLDVF